MSTMYDLAPKERQALDLVRKTPEASVSSALLELLIRRHLLVAERQGHSVISTGMIALALPFS